jgi:hypothetical protein
LGQYQIPWLFLDTFLKKHKTCEETMKNWEETMASSHISHTLYYISIIHFLQLILLHYY